MKNIKVIHSLNGIRGFAVLLVLLSHASNVGLSLHPQLNFSGAGRYGVFLFFVLSAFLLTRQFLEASPTRKEIKPFVTRYIIRRFLRIYPLFTLALLAYFILNKINFNVILMNEVSLIKHFFLLDGTDVFWTIPVEFQYYFLIPIVSVVLLRIRKPAFSVAIILVLFITTWWHFITPEYLPHLLPFLPIFLLGSIAAYASLKIRIFASSKPFIIHTCNFFALLCFLLFIVLTPNFYNMVFDKNIGGTHFHKEFLLFSVLSCCLVLFTISGDGFIKKLMENRFFVFWGNISFSAYLGHMIILKFLQLYIQLPPTVETVIFLTFTAFFSFLSYNFIEAPLSKQSLYRCFLFRQKLKY